MGFRLLWSIFSKSNRVDIRDAGVRTGELCATSRWHAHGEDVMVLKKGPPGRQQVGR